MATTTGPHRLAVRQAPADQASLILRTGLVVAPILFGLDKFTNLLTDWAASLAPAVDRLVSGTATGAMVAVGQHRDRRRAGGRGPAQGRRLPGRRLAGRHHRQPAPGWRPPRPRPARPRPAAGRPGPDPTGHRLRRARPQASEG